MAAQASMFLCPLTLYGRLWTDLSNRACACPVTYKHYLYNGKSNVPAQLDGS